MITLETLQTLHDTHRALAEDNLFYGVVQVRELNGLRGCNTVVVCGDTAYCCPDIVNSDEVKVVKVPEYKMPNMLFWEP